MQKKNKGGRPTREPNPGERFQISFRVTPELKRRLDAATQVSGRSQSQEAELRLQDSFEKQDVLLDALRLCFGRRFGGLLALLGEIMSAVANSAPMWRDEGDPDPRDLWIDSTLGFRRAVESARLLLTAAIPEDVGQDLTAAEAADLLQANNDVVIPARVVFLHNGDRTGIAEYSGARTTSAVANVIQGKSQFGPRLLEMMGVELLSKIGGNLAAEVTSQPWQIADAKGGEVARANQIFQKHLAGYVAVGNGVESFHDLMMRIERDIEPIVAKRPSPDEPAPPRAADSNAPWKSHATALLGGAFREFESRGSGETAFRAMIDRLREDIEQIALGELRPKEAATPDATPSKTLPRQRERKSSKQSK